MKKIPEPSIKDSLLKIDRRRPFSSIGEMGASEVSFLYCHMVIQALTESEGLRFFRACFRTLRPLGILRVTTTDLGSLVHDYLFDRSKPSDGKQRSCARLNAAFLLEEVQFLYDEESLGQSLELAGYWEIRRFMPGASAHPTFWNLDEDSSHTLILEATKPTE